MFILTTISDLVQIPPHEFYRPDHEELVDKINEKYSNKVVQNIGLCLCLHSLLSASDGLISHGTGNVNVNVTFTLIVFRPFKGEIVLGRIDRQDQRGVGVSTEFFDDIFVPGELLFPGCVFEPEEGVWVWHNTTNTEEGEEDLLYFDNGNTVRLRVEAEHWHDQAPDGSKKASAGETNGDTVKRKVPYRIDGSMAEPGLGDVMWW